MADLSRNSEVLLHGLQSRLLNGFIAYLIIALILEPVKLTCIVLFPCIANSVTVVEATVNEILYDEDGVRATGVRCALKGDSDSSTESASSSATSTEYRSPIVVIADGCFSKFRKQFLGKEVQTASHFVG